MTLPSSGDGSLTAVDLRQRRLEQQSDCTESELLSLAVVKVISCHGFTKLEVNTTSKFFLQGPPPLNNVLFTSAGKQSSKK